VWYWIYVSLKQWKEIEAQEQKPLKRLAICQTRQQEGRTDNYFLGLAALHMS
jgi:hypothetical protein